MQYTEIKTFQDACNVEGLDPEKVVPDFSCYPEQDRKAMTAHAQLVIIARALNRQANGGQEWKPDYADYEQYKYYPWFYLDGASGFRFDDYGFWYAYSSVGSRLCYISPDVAEHAATQFKDLYNDYFL